MSPPGSSDLPESRRAALRFLFGLASNGVYICPVCYQPGGSLLHCPSTLTGQTGGTFLLHFPWSHLRQTLSGILPCEARTFLSRSLSVLRQRPSVLLKLKYSTTFCFLCLYKTFGFNPMLSASCFALSASIKTPIFYTLKQLPPINSLTIEFCGIFSLLTPST